MSAKSALDLLPAVRLYVLREAAKGYTCIGLSSATFFIDAPAVIGNVQSDGKQTPRLCRRYIYGARLQRPSKLGHRGWVHSCLSTLAKQGLMWERQRPEPGRFYGERCDKQGFTCGAGPHRWLGINRVHSLQLHADQLVFDDDGRRARGKGWITDDFGNLYAPPPPTSATPATACKSGPNFIKERKMTNEQKIEALREALETAQQTLAQAAEAFYTLSKKPTLAVYRSDLVGGQLRCAYGADDCAAVLRGTAG